MSQIIYVVLQSVKRHPDTLHYLLAGNDHAQQIVGCLERDDQQGIVTLYCFFGTFSSPWYAEDYDRNKYYGEKFDRFKQMIADYLAQHHSIRVVSDRQASLL